MITNKMIWTITLLVIFVITHMYADRNPAGLFLNLPVGAKPSGIGGAFTSISDGINSAYWNPAGMTTVKNREILFMHNSYIADMNYDYLGFGQYSNTLNGVIGVQISILDQGIFERTLMVTSTTHNKAGEYSNKDMVLGMSYSRKLFNTLEAGATLKYISSKLDTSRATAAAFDFGIIKSTYLNDRQLNIGAVLQNIGTRLKYDSEKEPLPQNLKVGISSLFSLTDLVSMTVSIDNILLLTNNDYESAIGTELSVDNRYFARLGFNSRNDAGNGLCLGGGIKIASLNLDYSFEDYDYLEKSHKFSITYKFDGTSYNDSKKLVQNMEEKYEDAINEKEVIHENLEEYKNKNKNLKNTIVELKEDKQHIEDENKGLHNTIAQLSEDKKKAEELNKRNEALKSEQAMINENLKNQLSEQKKMTDDHIKKLDTVQETLKTQSKQIAEKEHDMSTLKNQFESLKMANENFKTEIDQYKKDTENIKNSLLKKSQENTAKTDAISALQEKMKNQTESIAQKEQELLTFQKRVKALKQENDSLKQEKTKLENKLKIATMEKPDKLKSISSLQETVKEQSEQIAKIEQQKKKLFDELKTLTENLNVLKKTQETIDQMNMKDEIIQKEIH